MIRARKTPFAIVALLAGGLVTAAPAVAQDNAQQALEDARAKLKEAGDAVGKAAQEFGQKAGETAKEIGAGIKDAAQKAGQDVSDYLADNPDLNRDLVDFGRKIGLPGFDDAKPSQGAIVAAVPPKAVPGGTVTLHAIGLPGSASVTVAVGTTVADAKPLMDAETDDRGTLKVSAPVPDDASAGASLIYVLEANDGRIRLASEPVAIVSPVNLVNVIGTLSKEGVECPALRGDNGELYTLIGSLGDFGPGDRVEVDGLVAEMSTCQQGTTLDVTKISGVE